MILQHTEAKAGRMNRVQVRDLVHAVAAEALVVPAMSSWLVASWTMRWDGARVGRRAERPDSGTGSRFRTGKQRGGPMRW